MSLESILSTVQSSLKQEVSADNESIVIQETTPTAPTKAATMQIIIPEQKPLDVSEQANEAVALAMRSQTNVVLANQDMQDKMQKAATTVIEKKVDSVVKKVVGENNEVSSQLEEEALNCFGYKPSKSIRKWQIKWAGGYHAILSAIWMFVAMFTFSPIIFVAKKVHNAAKVTWWGIVLGLVIWTVIITTPILIALTR